MGGHKITKHDKKAEDTSTAMLSHETGLLQAGITTFYKSTREDQGNECVNLKSDGNYAAIPEGSGYTCYTSNKSKGDAYFPLNVYLRETLPAGEIGVYSFDYEGVSSYCSSTCPSQSSYLEVCADDTDASACTAVASQKKCWCTSELKNEL